MPLTNIVNIQSYAWLAPEYASPKQFFEKYLTTQPPPPTFFPGLTKAQTFPARTIQDPLITLKRVTPRMRRASPISHYALEAAFRAIEHAGFTLDNFPTENTVLIFAASDGSVVYTRRFFQGICEMNAGAGSPLLFPETVYNAPSSHLSAILGLNNEALTIVSDATAGLQAILTASRLLNQSSCERCLVVAAQELDPITCEGYNAWGINRSKGEPSGPFVLSEGAAALLLTKKTSSLQCLIEQPWFCASKEQASQHFLSAFKSTTSAVVSSLAMPSCLSGESMALQQLPNTVTRYYPKQHLGEAFTVSTLWHICLAAELASQFSSKSQSVAVTIEGFNGQGGALQISPA